MGGGVGRGEATGKGEGQTIFPAEERGRRGKEGQEERTVVLHNIIYHIHI